MKLAYLLMDAFVMSLMLVVTWIHRENDYLLRFEVLAT